MKSVFDRVKECIVEQLGVMDEEVKPNAQFKEDLGADSLDQVELAMAFEEEFKLVIDDDDTENLLTVQAAVDYIDARLSEKKQ
jgi:acyl carrier protein